MHSNIKVRLLFIMMIFIILNMSIAPFFFYDFEIIRMNQDHHMFYTVYSGSIMFSILSLLAMGITKFEELDKSDWFFAGFFSFITILPIMVSATSVSITFAVAVFFVYLASITLSNESKYKMSIITSTKLRDLAFDISLSFFIISILLLLDLFFGSSPISGFQVTVRSFVWPLASSVSEEIVFRMFFFYIVIKLNDYVEVPFITMLLILSIPFALWHIIDESLNNGFIYALSDATGNLFLMSIILSILALKRNLFVAILVHFLHNFVVSSAL